MQCPQCLKIFRGSYELRRHMKIHDRIRKYQCPRCPSAFTTLKSLRFHEHAKHPESRPYKCHVCNKDLKHQNGLSCHMISFHPDIFHARYKCSECGKGFAFKCYMTIHMKVHGDKTCKKCGKKFKSAHALRVHMGISSNENTQCSLCGKTFSTPGNLNRHMIRVKHNDDATSSTSLMSGSTHQVQECPQTLKITEGLVTPDYDNDGPLDLSTTTNHHQPLDLSSKR